jgi:glycerol uptake facilitator-like aquaporin
MTTNAQKYAAEFIGTTLLITTVIGSGIMAENLSAGNMAIALLGNTLPTGAILYVLITALGPISGAHFNPAVTLVFALKKQLPVNQAIVFVVFQILGGLLGVLLAHYQFDTELFQFSSRSRTGSAQWLSEVIATFGLVFTILATLKAKPDAVAMTVGLYITAAYWFTSSTSFANPAVTIARSFTDTFSGISPTHMPVFIISQILGALLALAVCRWLLSENQR